MSEPFRHPLRVRYNECDLQGIVFNGNYLTYFDVAVTELWREAIGGWEKMSADHSVDAVVAESTIRYLSPLHFDDEFEVAIGVGRIGETSLILELAVERCRDRCAEGELRYVFIEPGQGTKKRIPEPVRESLAPYGS